MMYFALQNMMCFAMMFFFSRKNDVMYPLNYTAVYIISEGYIMSAGHIIFRNAGYIISGSQP